MFLHLSPAGYGVRTDQGTNLVAAYLIFEAMVPLVILQLAAILSSSTAKRWVVLVTLIITLILLTVYIMFEVII